MEDRATYFANLADEFLKEWFEATNKYMELGKEYFALKDKYDALLTKLQA